MSGKMVCLALTVFLVIFSLGCACETSSQSDKELLRPEASNIFLEVSYDSTQGRLSQKYPGGSKIVCLWMVPEFSGEDPLALGAGDNPDNANAITVQLFVNINLKGWENVFKKSEDDFYAYCGRKFDKEGIVCSFKPISMVFPDEYSHGQPGDIMGISNGISSEILDQEGRSTVKIQINPENWLTQP